MSKSESAGGGRPLKVAGIVALVGTVLAGAGLIVWRTSGTRGDSPADPPGIGAGAPVAEVGPVSTPPDPAVRQDSSGRRLFTILGAGDVLVHPELTHQAGRDAKRAGRSAALDFNPLFRHARPAVEGADLAICHLETPLAKP
ncbi:CapA family protein, partial [Streptomyces microflavus]|uniref:CapA family protein n=2 Tax=Actinomycetes TaxID=1760 RepID=UPI0033CA498D